MDILIYQIDETYFNVINDDEADVTISDAAKSLFIIDDGFMDAGSSYGIVLNIEESVTLAIGQRIVCTQDITLRNVEITGIYNGAIEKMKAVKINDNDDINDNHELL